VLQGWKLLTVNLKLTNKPLENDSVVELPVIGFVLLTAVKYVEFDLRVK